jgi:hypothetical protein
LKHKTYFYLVLTYMNYNGPRYQDTTGKEGLKGQGKQQGDLFLEARERARGYHGEAPRDRIVYLENLSGVYRPFVIRDVSHTDQIYADLLERFSMKNTENLAVKISPQRHGSSNRVFLDGVIPTNIEVIYITFYIRNRQ